MSLTAETVFGFSEHYLQSRYDNPQPTPQFHIDLWTLCCNTSPRVAIAAPRGHAKSTSVTHAYTLACVLFRKKDHVLIVSNTETQARDFLKDIAAELLENEELIKDFKIKGFEKHTDTEIIVRVGSDGHLFRILAKGSNQRVRGLKWRNKRPDLIVGDDLENDDIVMNEERRLKFKQWFFNALMPCLSDMGQIRLIGTILHLDSLLETVMPKDSKKTPVVVTPLADISSDKDSAWKSVRFRAHDADFSNILWPEKFSKERLLAIKRDYEDQGFPEGYAQEYLNYPIDESTAYFRKQDLRPMTEKDWEQPMRYYVGGDFAISQKSHSDYTALVVIGVDPEGQINIVDVRKGRWDTFEIVNEIITIYDRYKPDLFLFEKGQIWSAIEPVLLKESYKVGAVKSINYDTVPTVQDKKVRNRPLQHATRAGKIKIDETADWYHDTILELVRFPRGAHDDVVDALGHIAAKVLKLLEAPTVAQIREKNWREDKRRTMKLVGRSRVCGY